MNTCKTCKFWISHNVKYGVCINMNSVDIKEQSIQDCYSDFGCILHKVKE
jgi:hypothetical protein